MERAIIEPMTSTSEQNGLTPRRWLQSLASLERKRLRGAAFLGSLAGFQTVFIVTGLAWLIDQLVVHDRAPRDLSVVFILLAVAVVARALCQWGSERLSLDASLRIRRHARSQLLDKVAALGPVWLTSQQSGAIAAQAVEHVDALDGYFARFHPQMRITVWVPLVILAVVVSLDYLAAIFLLLAAPLIPLFMALVGMGAERMNRDQFAAVARLSAHFIDRVRGITTLQLFGHTVAAQEAVWQAADHYRRLSMRTLKLAFLSSAVLEFFSSVAIAVVAMYVGFGLLGYIEYGPAPSLTLFSGLAVLLLAPEFFQPLRTLSMHYHDRAAALGAAESIVNTLNQPPVMRAASPPATRDPQALVELEGVEVSYAARGVVLGPLDVTLRHGDVVAVSGESGSGKSTLLALLAGFVGASQGECRHAATTQVAWLDQQPCLLQGSLADNLRLADPEATHEAMQSALIRAGLNEVLNALPQGLDTVLGERGVGLSGGQAQRLALARVYLSRAPLVLLDEPTARLDSATEKAVVEALLDWAREGRTLVVATHHPAVIAAASRHLRVVNGQLQEVLA